MIFIKLITLKVNNIIMSVNNYIILNEKTNKGILVDCSYDFETINKFINDNNIEITHVILTHCHYDHISGVNGFIYDKDVKVLIGNIESPILNKPDYNLCHEFEEDLETINIYKTLNDNEVININDIDIKVIETPGHTKGSICLLVEDNLISGDTIFKDAHGRCDLLSGNYNDIINSIKNKILVLPKNITIYPGHGDITTIIDEIKKYS